MNIIIKLILPVIVTGLLNACGELNYSSNAILEKPKNNLEQIEKPSHSFDSTVVCCFCGMLDN